MCSGGSSEAASVPTGNQHDIIISYLLVSEVSNESLVKEEEIKSYFINEIVSYRFGRKKLNRVSKRNSTPVARGCSRSDITQSISHMIFAEFAHREICARRLLMLGALPLLFHLRQCRLLQSQPAELQGLFHLVKSI